MAEYNGAWLTDKGKALLAKAQAGVTTIDFTHMEAGSGTYADDEILDGLSSMRRSNQVVGVGSVNVVNSSTVRVRSVFSNIDLTEGYFITEIGLFARDPDEGEILYSIVTAKEGRADYMAGYNGISPVSITISMHSTVSNAASVSVVGDYSAYLSVADFNEFKTSIGVIGDLVVDIFEQSTEEFPNINAGETVKVIFGKIKKFIDDFKIFKESLKPQVFAEGETVLEWALSVNTAHAMKYSTLDVCPEDSAERDNGLYEVFFDGKGWRRIEFRTMSWKDRKYFRILRSESEWLQDSGWMKIE